MARNPRKRRAAAATSHLDDDLVECNILPRLSAKALIRFKSVSKRWHRLISSHHPLFVHQQSQHAASAIMPSMYVIPNRCLSADTRSIGIPSFWKDITQISKSFLLPVVVASCNGLLCCVKYDHIDKIVIGNPALKVWKLVPANPRGKELKWRDVVFGLSVDIEESFVRFELVLLIKVNCKEFELHVFSSTKQQWSVATERILVLGLPTDIYSNRVSIYVKRHMYWKLEGCLSVLRINMENKLSSLQTLPPGIVDFNHGHMGECGGMFSCSMINLPEIHMWWHVQLFHDQPPRDSYVVVRWPELVQEVLNQHKEFFTCEPQDAAQNNKNSRGI